LETSRTQITWKVKLNNLENLKQKNLIIISVNIVPSWSNVSSPDDTTEPVVIGARYTYNSLVTSTTSYSNKPAMLPSQYPSSSTTQPLHSSTQRKHTFATSQHNEKQKKKNHARSASHPKSFNAFLKDTNDEWSDDIQVTNVHPIAEKDPTIDHEALAKATEAVLSVTSPQPSAPPLKKKKSVNPNGIKEHLQDLLLGKKKKKEKKEKKRKGYFDTCIRANLFMAQYRSYIFFEMDRYG
jgi:hypothetical protein